MFLGQWEECKQTGNNALEYNASRSDGDAIGVAQQNMLAWHMSNVDNAMQGLFHYITMTEIHILQGECEDAMERYAWAYFAGEEMDIQDCMQHAMLKACKEIDNVCWNL